MAGSKILLGEMEVLVQTLQGYERAVETLRDMVQGLLKIIDESKRQEICIVTASRLQRVLDELVILKRRTLDVNDDARKEPMHHSLGSSRLRHSSERIVQTVELQSAPCTAPTKTPASIIRSKENPSRYSLAKTSYIATEQHIGVSEGCNGATEGFGNSGFSQSVPDLGVGEPITCEDAQELQISQDEISLSTQRSEREGRGWRAQMSAKTDDVALRRNLLVRQVWAAREDVKALETALAERDEVIERLHRRLHAMQPSPPASAT